MGKYQNSEILRMSVCSPMITIYLQVVHEYIKFISDSIKGIRITPPHQIEGGFIVRKCNVYLCTS